MSSAWRLNSKPLIARLLPQHLIEEQMQVTLQWKANLVSLVFKLTFLRYVTYLACGLYGFAEYTCSREVLREQCLTKVELAVYLPARSSSFLSLLPLSIPTRVSAFVTAIIMAPQLDAAQRILIKTMLYSRRVRGQANSLKSLVHRARCPENPPRETAIQNAHPKNNPRRPPQLHFTRAD